MSQRTVQPNETEAFPCEECGGMVDLSALIRVSDGDAYSLMSEYAARALLDELGIPRPPVLCSDHERIEIVTEAEARA